MGRTCDVCGAAIGDDERFCPACGLEVVEPAVEPPGPSPSTTDPWDWPSDVSQSTADAASTSTDYVLQDAAPDTERAREQLQTAQQLLAQGRLRQCGELLQAAHDRLGADPQGRQRFLRIAQQLKKTKAGVIRQAEELLDDPPQLHRFLTGPAAEQLSQKETCRIALEAVRRHYRQRAESVHTLLRLAAFRRIGDKQLRAEHERLERLVWRKKRRQHFYLSAGIFSVVMLLAVPGLIIWIWFLMQFSFRLKLLISVVALVALIWGINPLRKWITLMVEGREEDEDDD
jgi:hypothetical protein